MGNLKYGEYELKETVAPNGYIKFLGAVPFTIASADALEVLVANTKAKVCQAFALANLM